ncbi:MAG TPA: ABC transporter permease, partial [Phytomonospora sp.]
MTFLLRRFVFYVVTAWAAITLNFFIPRMLPGNPVQSLINRYQGQLSTDATQALYAMFGLDKETSVWQQYLDYWANLFQGDFGLS